MGENEEEVEKKKQINILALVPPKQSTISHLCRIWLSLIRPSASSQVSETCCAAVKVPPAAARCVRHPTTFFPTNRCNFSGEIAMGLAAPEVKKLDNEPCEILEVKTEV